MKFFSTTDHQHIVELREAVIQGLAPRGGLFLPCELKPLSHSFWQEAKNLSLSEVAMHLAQQLLSDSLPVHVLESIVQESINFPVPIVEIENSISAVELFHGPTLAFKDFGARFMARVMGYFMQDQAQELTVLVATSGDTGGAVASGFYKTPGVRVILLYPSGKVSELQELQLTTMGENITALEIDGTFDDCQHLVKQAFSDSELRKKFLLSSANSINIARLIPQSFYYGFAAAQRQSKTLVFSVPSGNFGNLTAGILAKKLGAPIHSFLAATNQNDVVPQYLESGIFQPRPSVQTISNAMDVGNPSNFARLLSIFNESHPNMRQFVRGYMVSDEQTKLRMATTYQKYGYILDPHGAVGLEAVVRDQQQSGESYDYLFLETAHPAKFIDVVESTLKTSIDIPERLAALRGKTKKATALTPEYALLRDFITATS